MTDALMEEIYGLTREALKAGQPNFQLQAFPFRMTDARMAQLKSNKWYSYWKTLKQGYDYFEKYRLPPNVTVCERRYVVGGIPLSRPDPTGRCPAFSRPVVSAFTPLPEPAEVEVANGNKLKGITNPDVEPTVADINAAKRQQAAQATSNAPPLNATSMAASSPVANAN